MSLRIVLMGPPGAGKGTQAKRLVEKFGFSHLSSGDIFRAEKASGSELGQKLAEYMNAGQLVPDEVVVAMMAKAITAADGAGSGLMLDGFPRTVPQAEALDKQLAEAARPLDGVVVITCDDEPIVERITGRRSCPGCGKVFHVKYLQPKQEGVCDDCGGELVQRPDDKEDVVRSRLKAYYEQTEPVIGYYRDSGGVQVVQVDGNGSPDDVTASLVESVGALG